jgi:hypothetical protein
MSDPNEPKKPPPPPVPLTYRSPLDDRNAPAVEPDPQRAVGAGCLMAMSSLVAMIVMDLIGGGNRSLMFILWFALAPLLLLIGAGMALARQNWAFFFGALIAVLILVGMSGLIAMFFG